MRNNMKKIAIFMADGCEEIEGLTVVDILRRAGYTIDMISISDHKKVTGSHQISFEADAIAKEVNFEEYDGVVLPGGMPGTLNLKANEIVQKTIADYAKAGKLVSAICAAPSVLGEANLLAGKKACCYPGFEDKLLSANVVFDQVAVDENVITSRGMGTAIPFALAMIAYFDGKEKADQMAASIIY